STSRFGNQSSASTSQQKGVCPGQTAHGTTETPTFASLRESVASPREPSCPEQGIREQGIRDQGLAHRLPPSATVRLPIPSSMSGTSTTHARKPKAKP